MWIEIKQLIFIAYLSNVINCGKLLNLNVNDLKEYLLNNGNVKNDKLYGLNRVLVKRVVPHGYESKGVEYYKNYIYKPLVRFPVHKPINDDSLASDDEQQNEKLYKVHQLKDLLDNLGQNSQRVNGGSNKRMKINKVGYRNNDGVIELLKLLGDKSDDRNDDERGNSNRKNKQKSHDAKLLLKLLHAGDKNDDINKYSKFKKITRELLGALYDEKSKTKKEYWDKEEKKMENYNEKKDFYKNLINTFTQALRYGKTKEEPKTIFEMKEEAAANMTNKPKMSLPFYPYWNWWTYKKNLYHDNCRNGWVRFHNMCYEMPPH